MEWVNEWDFREVPEVLTTETLVRFSIKDTEVQGELESLRNGVEILTKIVSKMVAALPESAQKEIIKEINYGWKPKGD